jgi:hypothetical protein
MVDNENDNKPAFTLVLVVPVPTDGSIDPERNQYYEVPSQDMLWSYHEDGSGKFTREPRRPLDKTLPPASDWMEYVSRDVSMAHTPTAGLTIRPFGTFLVNLAAFFNKDRS